MKGGQVGEFEELTLLTVRALGEPVYAVPVQRFLESQAGRVVSMGAVYAALGRLEAKGLLRSAMGDATPERGGKSKRLYEITPEGKRAIETLRSVRERIWRTIEEEGR
jgi:DNA-binding PadR family transcriptional regulator